MIDNQEGRFLSFYRRLMTLGLPLIKTELTSLAKSVLIPLALSAGMSAADAAIQKKLYGSDCPSDLALLKTALIISNEELEDKKKIVKSLQESGLLIKRINKKFKNETKVQKGRFFLMLLGALATIILGNALTGKTEKRTGKGVIRVGQNF